MGDELIIVYSKQGDFVIFQSSKGEPTAPVVTPAKIIEQQIAFSLPPPFAERGKHIGKISSDGLQVYVSCNGYAGELGVEEIILEHKIYQVQVPYLKELTQLALVLHTLTQVGMLGV